MDKIGNEYIGRTAQMGRFGEKTRLMWFVHVRMKDYGFIRGRMLRRELSGKGKQ